MEEQKRYRKIEDWLSGKLSGDALKKFESDLKTDKELALEAEIIRDLSGAGKDSSRKQLRATLANIRSRKAQKTLPFYRRKGFLRSAAAILILVAGYFIFNQKEETEQPFVETPPNQELVPEVLTPDKELINDKTADNLAETKNITPPGNKTAAPATPKTGKTPSNPDRSEKIAAGDAKIDVDFWEDPNDPVPHEGKGYANKTDNFRENPALERAIFENLTRIQIELISPKKNAAYTAKSGKVNLSFSGLLKTTDESEKPSVQVLLFSNKPEDFQKGKAIFGQELSLQNQGSDFSFSLEKEVPLSPGLFYFIFEEPSSKTILKVGKFVVN